MRKSALKYSTLPDILSSLQFKTVILLTLGLNTHQIADLFGTSEQTVCNSISQCFDQVGCRSLESLTQRLRYEYESDLYDERLEKELAELQNSARRMLEKLASTNDLDSFTQTKELPPTSWVV